MRQLFGFSGDQYLYNSSTKQPDSSGPSTLSIPSVSSPIRTEQRSGSVTPSVSESPDGGIYSEKNYSVHSSTSVQALKIRTDSMQSSASVSPNERDDTRKFPEEFSHTLQHQFNTDTKRFTAEEHGSISMFANFTQESSLNFSQAKSEKNYSAEDIHAEYLRFYQESLIQHQKYFRMFGLSHERAIYPMPAISTGNISNVPHINFSTYQNSPNRSASLNHSIDQIFPIQESGHKILKRATSQQSYTSCHQHS